ncbi:MAG: DUF308 domain-containing protein [Ruminococcus sp.]|nr:DUF308 domain-containing protein [Ruminococcus sp.]
MEKLKKLLGNYYLLSAFCILLGLFFIIWPDMIPRAISYILGGVIILCGVIEIGRFVTAKENESSPAWLVRGIVFGVLGVFLIIKPDVLYRVIAIILGIYLLTSGIIALYNSMLVRKHNNGVGWQPALVFAVVTIILGIVMLFASKLPFIALGVMLVISGLSNFFGSVTGTRKAEKVLGITTSKDDGSGDRKFIDVK